MPIKIGIPRGLFYYKFIYFWRIFFSELGAEIIVSDATNKRILEDGIKVCVDEACLPMKLFCGHVINLRDRVDYMLVPRFTSISEKEYICPEFGGLPDMIRHTIKDLPMLIDTEINMRKSEKGGIKAAVETGAILGADKRAAVRAYKAALAMLRCTGCNQGDGSLDCGDGTTALAVENRPLDYSRPLSPCTQAVENRPRDSLDYPRNHKNRPLDLRLRNHENRPLDLNHENRPSGSGSLGSRRNHKNRPLDYLDSLDYPRLRVAVIGHPYNVYDTYISMNLLGKLEKYGAEVKTVEMVDKSDIDRQAAKLAKPMFWYYGRNAYGAAIHMAGAGGIDGLICITSFGCGIDSFVHDIIERRVRKEFEIPFISITIDEHSGEAGFNTRLEAFIDMLHWRKLHENNFPSFG